MALQLLMRWGCKEKVKFRDFVHSEIVRPPVPMAGHELVIIEIVHHIRLARATPYKRLDPDHATTHAARHGHGSSLYQVSSPFARVDGRLLKKVTRQVTEGRFVEQKRSPGHRPILRSIPSIHLDSFLGPPSIVRSKSPRRTPRGLGECVRSRLARDARKRVDKTLYKTCIYVGSSFHCHSLQEEHQYGLALNKLSEMQTP
ncbi:hypothetical protein E4U12_000240 [Claviceps purpurea]|nr:hypothetical protein E4U12_000240 [Claviceps purpurea]